MGNGIVMQTEKSSNKDLAKRNNNVNHFNAFFVCLYGQSSQEKSFNNVCPQLQFKLIRPVEKYFRILF